MFVSDLDCPWHQTPFPIQGFHIRHQHEIQSLISHCKWVMIDVAEGRDVSTPDDDTFSPPGRKRKDQNVAIKLPPIHIRQPRQYDVQTSMKKEARQASVVLEDAEAALQGVTRQFRDGEAPDLRAVSRVARGMMESVVRHPDALLWMTRIREHDDHSYRHAMNASVWALICGRHFGIDENALHSLAMGTLLAHVGKLDLPESIVQNEDRLNADDYRTFQKYVEYGVRRLKDADVARPVLSVVRYHRERHNGSGFPSGLRGDRIPLLGKIAGLVDYYESLVEPRPGRRPMTSAQAVAHLYELRNIAFQEDLVERFIQSVGLYPTGTLVQLSDGQRGAVISHSPERRLWPRVMVMTDQEHQPLKKGRIINLAEYNKGRDASQTLNITACLPLGTAGLNPMQYEVTGARVSRWSIKRLVG
ncbi:HD domain-containing protein [Tamilnaduibacter salinus]|nr:HD domain-containing protein [Tamilnaduibacter salinus]